MSARDAFTRARSEGRAALVGYLPAGFPDVAGSMEAMRTMVDAGCDVIEIGLPYSDPVMDGPTIQAAAQQALDRGVRIKDVLRTVEAVAGTGTPTLVMTYWNPVERYGVAQFAADLASAGGAGLITPDITPDSDPAWSAAADEHDLDKVYLVAPSSTDERIAMTTAASRGFVYATAVMGVTGARTTTSDLAGPLVARTKAALAADPQREVCQISAVDRIERGAHRSVLVLTDEHDHHLAAGHQLAQHLDQRLGVPDLEARGQHHDARPPRLEQLDGVVAARADE